MPARHLGTRILFAIGRDGLFTARTVLVSSGGTPRVALLLTADDLGPGLWSTV